MSTWEQYDIVRQVRCNGLLMGVAFHEPQPDGVTKDWWVARTVREEMLKHGHDLGDSPAWPTGVAGF